MRKAFHCSGNLLTSGQETTCKKGYTDGLPSINHQLKADTATVPSSSPLPSPNFQFLGRKNTMLISIAGYAESYVFTDPNAAMFKLRQFGSPGDLLANPLQVSASVPLAIRLAFDTRQS